MSRPQYNKEPNSATIGLFAFAKNYRLRSIQFRIQIFNIRRVKISFKAADGRVELLVSDNGRGMSKQDRSKPRSFGIRGMRERSRFLGGDVRIDSMPGKGVTVIVSIPYDLSQTDQFFPEQKTLF